MTVPEFFDQLGIRASILVAGLSGGFLRGLSRKQYKAREMFASPICGALAAAYLTAPVVHYLKAIGWPLPAADQATEHATAFMLGVCAMWISDAVFEAVVRHFKPREG